MKTNCDSCGAEVRLADMPSPYEVEPRNENNERRILCLECQGKRSKRFSFIGLEVIESIPKASGNGAVVYVPKKWTGSPVAVVLLQQYNRTREAIFQTIRMIPEKTVLSYMELCNIFPLEHPEDIVKHLEELLREERILGSVTEGFRANPNYN
ncbi:hypothetical protein ANME2D_02471 [Candidatus Methanoperedens nitroreducens]|uniref:Uncharacterized protein n=1 Tax=Candidatus Methanoperedens nitratireducens TaxID=1392998 RepID=A0A062V647_9EURY|nr:DUF2080 family transposase-associated protein [Candidatus Methanoperedens nitroreducens]KCZ71269.1 hypothetical protein ANME2D_02471 [Candidatus Methanoperedens nitroreducens]MDJ1420305.1 DUF2080 family transposase-associated protein [Candidatus Methanoperedens sp.]